MSDKWNAAWRARMQARGVAMRHLAPVALRDTSGKPGAPILWTPELDSWILGLHQAGANPTVIGASIGVSNTTVVSRLGKLAASGPPAAPDAIEDDAIAPARVGGDDDGGAERETLRAGHPVTWGALLALTPCLGASVYDGPADAAPRRSVPAIQELREAA